MLILMIQDAADDDLYELELRRDALASVPVDGGMKVFHLFCTDCNHVQNCMMILQVYDDMSWKYSLNCKQSLA